MADQRVVRVVSVERCDDVAYVRFERPVGYRFAAAQWLRLTLQTAEGPQTRTFSHAVAPGEDPLEIVTRISSSAFKVALAALSPNDKITLSGPGGRFGLPAGTTRAVCLIGGVGVAPLRSIVRERVLAEERFEDLLVFFGNGTPECVPYLGDLRGLSGAGVRVVEVYEEAGPEWTGETGFITVRTLSRFLAEDDGRVFLVAGPPVMVTAMERVLDEFGVEQGRRIVERLGPTIRAGG